MQCPTGYGPTVVTHADHQHKLVGTQAKRHATSFPDGSTFLGAAWFAIDYNVPTV